MKAIILDRDGVINQDSVDYIKSVDEFVFLPGSIEAIVDLTKAGYKIGVATNQSGIARGHYSEDILWSIHQYLKEKVGEKGGEINGILYCKHMPDEGCHCRKPKPGMLVDFANHFATAIEDMHFVGDRVTDIQAAYNAGAKPILIHSQMTDVNLLDHYPKVPSFPSLKKFVMHLLHDAV